MIRSATTATILGCGSSPGVPRINGDWGRCDPDNPRNRRLRASIMIERRISTGKNTTIVIDTGPDFRQQMLLHQVRQIDCVVYTHAHADHIHGIDDLRSFVLGSDRLLPIYADEPTLHRLHDSFGYCFYTPPGSNYPPILDGHEISEYEPLAICGHGGEITLLPVRQLHGEGISLGFRIGDFAYCTDVSDFPERTVDMLQGLDTLIIGALQERRHPSHFSLEEALAWIERLKPRQAFFTHMHVPLDYEQVDRSTPPNVHPSHDGLKIDIG